MRYENSKNVQILEANGHEYYMGNHDKKWCNSFISQR